MRTLWATRSGVCIIQQGRHLPMVLKQPTTHPFTALTTAESKSKKELQQPTKQPCMALTTAENASKSESHRWRRSKVMRKVKTADIDSSKDAKNGSRLVPPPLAFRPVALQQCPESRCAWPRSVPTSLVAPTSLVR